MKFSIFNRQPLELRKEADEIKMDYRDIDTLVDLLDENITKKLVIMVGEEDTIDFDKLKVYQKGLNITLAIPQLSMSSDCINHGFPFYWLYPVSTYFEMRTALELGASEVILNAPLYFDLPQAKKVADEYHATIRLVANICSYTYLGRQNGICGTYIRPEDVSVYEKYVDTIEFVTETLSQEGVLFEIYAVKKHWNGNLSYLLTNFNCQVDNRAFPEEFAAARVQCRQDCMRRGTCHLCDTLVNYANALVKTKPNK